MTITIVVTETFLTVLRLRGLCHHELINGWVRRCLSGGTYKKTSGIGVSLLHLFLAFLTMA